MDVVGFYAELDDGWPLVDFDNGGGCAEAVEGVFDDFDLFADGVIVEVGVCAGFEEVG